MGDTDARILDAAQALFAAHGYAGTTTRALAESAGVNEVTLFRRFGSKAGILQALGARIAAQTPATSGAPLPDDDLRTALKQLAAGELESARRFGPLVLRLTFEAASQPDVAAALGAGAARNRHAVAALLAERQRRGELRDDLPADLLTEAFFALTSSLLLGRALAGQPTAEPGSEESQDDPLADRVVSLFLAGAGAAPGPRPPEPDPSPHRRSS